MTDGCMPCALKVANNDLPRPLHEQETFSRAELRKEIAKGTFHFAPKKQ